MAETWSGGGQSVAETWSGGGQSVAETWSGGGQSVAETCTGQARHVSATSQPQVTVNITSIYEEVKGSAQQGIIWMPRTSNINPRTP